MTVWFSRKKKLTDPSQHNPTQSAGHLKTDLEPQESPTGSPQPMTNGSVEAPVTGAEQHGVPSNIAAPDQIELHSSEVQPATPRAGDSFEQCATSAKSAGLDPTTQCTANQILDPAFGDQGHCNIPNQNPDSATQHSNTASSSHSMATAQAADRQSSHNLATTSATTLPGYNNGHTGHLSHSGTQSSTTPKGKVTKPGCIFVSIAAYRDPECQWTIRDLFKQADAPELVHVGVVWQVDAVEDAAFVRVAGADKRHRQVQQHCQTSIHS